MRWIPKTDEDKAIGYAVLQLSGALRDMFDTSLPDHWQAVIVPDGHKSWDESGYFAARLDIRPTGFAVATLLEGWNYPMKLWIEVSPTHYGLAGTIRIWWILEANEHTLNTTQENYWPYKPVLSFPDEASS